MKLIFSISILISGLLLVGFNKTAIHNPSINHQLQTDSVPKMNQLVLDFVNRNMKKKVGTGECWDLANGALKHANATWDGQYKFGREIDYKKEPVHAGDIIQLEGVILNYEMNGSKYTEKMTHHTAIIYTVKDKSIFTIAHQNNGFSGKKVGISPMDISTVTKGKFKIYRPQ
ncbi:MAG: hypothetical protein V4565_13680 [Bacteroidota bacterium]